MYTLRAIDVVADPMLFVSRNPSGILRDRDTNRT
jgi:hypothetical protein